jgi:hypothetical protein
LSFTLRCGQLIKSGLVVRDLHPVIELLKETGGVAFGFKVVGKLLDEELKTFAPQLEFFIAQHKKHPIGILVDLTEMHGAEWKARWDDLRFLQKHTSHIARMAVVGANRWEEVVDLFTAGAAVLQSETRYFESSEMQNAWHSLPNKCLRKCCLISKLLTLRLAESSNY